MYTFRYNNGKVLGLNLRQYNEGGESEEGLKPVQTDLLSAPDELLRMIRCNCQTDCSTLRCTCKKHNVKCPPTCGNCRRSVCINSDRLTYEGGDVSVYETLKKVCVAISFRLTQNLSQNACTIRGNYTILLV